MIVYTRTSVNFLENILGNKPIQYEKGKSENFQIFQTAYSWINKKLSEKVHLFYEDLTPIWFWYKINGEEVNFDKIEMMSDRLKPYLIIQYNVDLNEVLLSDYQRWHMVLTQRFLALSEEERDFWDSLLEEKPFKLLKDNEKEIIMDSWSRCICPTQDSEIWEPSEYADIQGCLWKINQNQILSYKIVK